jgi:hypothetical protein
VPAADLDDRDHHVIANHDPLVPLSGQYEHRVLSGETALSQTVSLSVSQAVPYCKLRSHLPKILTPRGRRPGKPGAPPRLCRMRAPMAAGLDDWDGQRRRCGRVRRLRERTLARPDVAETQRRQRRG